MLDNSIPPSPGLSKKTIKSEGDFNQPPVRSRVKTIKVNTVVTKAGKRAGTPIPYQFKTPLRLTQRIHPLTSAKPSPNIAEKTILSASHKDFKLDKTEIKLKHDPLIISAENADTEERRYTKLAISSVQKTSSESNSFKVKEASQEASKKVEQKIYFDQGSEGEEDNREGYVTPYILAQKQPDIVSTKDTVKESNVKLKRKFFENTPMYIPNKRVKKNHEYFQDSVKLYDKIRKEHIKFRVFKDKDLGNNRFVQNTLKDAKIDDDCPTDSEQMELAKRHIIRQLKQSIEIQTPRNTPESQPHLVKLSSIDSRLNTSQFSASADFTSVGRTSSFNLDSRDGFSIDFKNFTEQQEKLIIVKKLSYGKLEDDFLSVESFGEDDSEKSKEIIYFDMLN